jgi:hypothetical protein
VKTALALDRVATVTGFLHIYLVKISIIIIIEIKYSANYTDSVSTMLLRYAKTALSWELTSWRRPLGCSECEKYDGYYKISIQ